jgi:hypothetical protein
VGVPEECWPLNFTIALPETDGRVTGFRTVGDNLFVLTDNSIYAVVGQDVSTYVLSKVSAKGKGTSHFATCVIPGEDVNSTDVLVHFGNDGRLYFLFGSGGDFPISYPIQGELDALGFGSLGSQAAASVTLGVMHTSLTAYIVMVPVAGGNRYLYDLERKIWIKTSALGYGTGYVEGLYSNAMYQFVTTYGSPFRYAYVENQPSTFGTEMIQTNYTSFGTDKKDDKTLESVTVYTNDPNPASITCSVFIDQASSPTTLVQIPNTGTYNLAYHEGVDAIVFVPQFAARGRIFSVQVSIPSQTTLNAYIYEITAKASNTTDQPKTGGSL